MTTETITYAKGRNEFGDLTYTTADGRFVITRLDPSGAGSSFADRYGVEDTQRFECHYDHRSKLGIEHSSLSTGTLAEAKQAVELRLRLSEDDAFRGYATKAAALDAFEANRYHVNDWERRQIARLRREIASEKAQ